MLQTLTASAANIDGNAVRIACAIAYLSENYAAQPSLDEAAGAAGLSPYHFQREFSRLAGVSPKSFVAHLTLQRAKAQLANGATVLQSALDAGLSGPSRLHDLCLKIEAMTPGTYAKGGAGLRLAYGFHACMFGTALLMATERGLCGMAFGNPGDEDAMLADMSARWPQAEIVCSEIAIAPYVERIFSRGSGSRAAMPIQLFGTPWQISRYGKPCSPFLKGR